MMVDKETAGAFEYHVGRYHRMQSEATTLQTTVKNGEPAMQMHLAAMQADLRAARGKAAACKLAYLVLIYRASRLGSVGGHAVWDLDLQAKSDIAALEDGMQENITTLAHAEEKERQEISDLIEGEEKAAREVALIRQQKDLSDARLNIQELARYNKFRELDQLEPSAIQQIEADMIAEQAKQQQTITTEEKEYEALTEDLRRKSTVTPTSSVIAMA